MNIERYTYPKIELFLYSEFIDYLYNDIELIKIQVKIAQESLEGYSIKFNNEIIPISNNGELKTWPKGMYDQSQRQYAKLFRIRSNKSF